MGSPGSEAVANTNAQGRTAVKLTRNDAKPPQRYSQSLRLRLADGGVRAQRVFVPGTSPEATRGATGWIPPTGENILALHKFLTRFQIAAIFLLLSAPAAPNPQRELLGRRAASSSLVISSTKI